MDFVQVGVGRTWLSASGDPELQAKEMQFPSESMPKTPPVGGTGEGQESEADTATGAGFSHHGELARGCSRWCPGHAWCTCACKHQAMQLSSSPSHGFGLLSQLTWVLRVGEQAEPCGEHLSKAVAPGRKALCSWRAEEGLSCHRGWDLNPVSLSG